MDKKEIESQELDDALSALGADVNGSVAESEESDTLDAFSFGDGDENSGKGAKKPKKAGMVKKQIIMVSVFAAVALILTLVYFLVLRPIFNERTKEEEQEIVPLIEGEVRDSGGVAILMFPHVEKKNLNKITVKNSYGGYTLQREVVADGSANVNFIIADHPASSVSAETVSKIVVSGGYSVVMRRLEDSCPDDQLYKYGLAPGDSYTTVTVEDIAGNSYEYYVGSIIPSGGGYYCRYSTRSAIYIINSESASILNQSSQSLLSPMLGYPIGGDGATMVDLFGITKNGEEFITFAYDEAESGQTAQSVYKMLYPGEYVIDSDIVSASVTATLASLEGAMVIEAGNGTTEGLLYKNEKLMAEYGFHDLEKPAYELYYQYGDYPSYIIFTESGIDGYYYAYSYIWDTIVLVAETSVPYLKWGLLDFLRTKLFFDEIGEVDYISVSGNAYNKYDISEKFYYDMDEYGTIHSKAESTGWEYDGNYSERNYAQSFFLTVAMINIQGYASDIDFDKSKATEYARMEIKLKDGTVNTYVFYRQGGGGTCYYEINGEGEFYVLKRQIDKMLVDAVRAANNCAVDWEAEWAEYPSENEMLGTN